MQFWKVRLQYIRQDRMPDELKESLHNSLRFPSLQLLVLNVVIIHE